MTFDDYMNNLQNACGMAVRAIGRYFGKFKSGSKEFRWFQTTPQYPAFQHLGFRFKNQVYRRISGSSFSHWIRIISGQGMWKSDMMETDSRCEWAGST